MTTCITKGVIRVVCDHTYPHNIHVHVQTNMTIVVINQVYP